MSDKPNNGHRDENPPPAEISPIIMGRPGRPSFSLEALRERIERQFQEETADRADILLELDNEIRRRALLREVADYVLAVEAVTISEADKRTLLEKAYRNLFTFGPLDAYLRDDRVTEITVNGPRNISVRHSAGKLEPIEDSFNDINHLENVLRRVLATGGAILSETEPFLEVGVSLAGRPARLSLIAPPVSPFYNLEIRLHPPRVFTLDDLAGGDGLMTEQAAHLLRAILAASHGLLIVGEAGLGKTTLASALAQILPGTAVTRAVERAAELRLPDHAQRHAAALPAPGSVGCNFVCQFAAALELNPDWLIADEIRGDESPAVCAALLRDDAPHYLWVFRGDSQIDRLRSALSMIIRKHLAAVEQDTINRAIARHLPFVAALKNVNGVPRLALIAEWTLGHDASLALRPLLNERDDGMINMSNRPTRALNLPDDFWG